MLCLRWLRTNVHAKCVNGYTWADPEGGQGVRTPPPPLKNHKNIVFFSNVGQSYQASIQFRVIIGTLANRHLNGVSLVGRLWPAFIVVFGSSHLKKRCKVGPPLAILSGSAHGLYIISKSFVTTASPQPLSRTGISIAW